MFIELLDGRFINVMSMETIGPGYNPEESSMQSSGKSSEGPSESLCIWPENREQGHALLDIKREQDPLLWEWVNFNLRQGFIKRHWFVSMKDILISWTLHRQDCLNRMNAPQKLMVPANLGSKMGERQPDQNSSPAKQDKALYTAIERFMDTICLEPTSPIRKQFSSKKSAGFDALAALLAPIVNEARKVASLPLMDENYQGSSGEAVSPYKLNASLSKMREKLDAINSASSDRQADQIVIPISSQISSTISSENAPSEPSAREPALQAV